MVERLKSEIELRAEKAEELRTFSGVKLLHIKKQVELILNHIGDIEIFSEYTKHDISHIDEMLRLAEWVIPEETQKIMTSSEWMMLVLSIYFHDMGMVVTKREFENRNNSDFIEYKKKVCTEQDYKKKVEKLENPDKFLYQEYVRKNHAKRIRMWITGELNENAGVTNEIVNEIQELLKNIDSLFRQDLAMICESHHTDHLDDYSIYDTNKCYESSENGKVNLQYIAIILRTVDLLHITMDRAPAVEYRVFCPTDPTSIIEWQKQKAIRVVKPQEMRDEEGNIDKSIQSDTIAITAYFEEANQAEAFFALMDYIRYARVQLKNSYEFVQAAIKKQGTSKYLFPWKEINDKGIKTKNFSNHLLKFELDQNNILQMLVGHTLYNDTSVVLRELVQNGLDAIKLQNEIERKDNKELTDGKIIVSYDEESNILSFADNGTGMTVFDIENYLLRVGSSKYGSTTFQKEHPNFVSISRFGIGILTCFLVADDIEIITCSSENGEANTIFFRNVDGKYLLKTMYKKDLPKHIAEHGTEIKLHLRKGNAIDRLEYNLRKWIVFPYCKVFLKINNLEPQKIGYTSPREALEEYIKSTSMVTNIIVKEVEQDGIILAYALRYREYLQEYSLVEYNRSYVSKEKMPVPIGICFEGIRIADNTPGYGQETFLAIMNSSNNKLVKTNVARSSVEENEGKNELLKIIYSIYKKNIDDQIKVFKEKGRSLSWISSEIKFLVNQFVNFSDLRFTLKVIENKKIMEDVFGKIDGILYEKNDKRQLVSAEFIQNLNYISMIESNMIDAAEQLLKETQNDMSLSGLVNTITKTNDFFPENLVCDFERRNLLHTLALRNKTVQFININKDEKKIEIHIEEGNENWTTVSLIINDSYEDYSIVYIPNHEKCNIQGLEQDELGVKTRLGVFLSPESELTKYIIESLELFDITNSEIEKTAFRIFASLVINKQTVYLSKDNGIEIFEKNFHNKVERMILEHASDDIKDILWKKISREDLISNLYAQKLSIYDLNDWSRKFL